MQDHLRIYQHMHVPEPELPAAFSREEQVAAVYTSYDEDSKSRDGSVQMSDRPTNIKIKNGRKLVSRGQGPVSATNQSFNRRTSEGNNSDKSAISLFFPMENNRMEILENSFHPTP